MTIDDDVSIDDPNVLAARNGGRRTTSPHPQPGTVWARFTRPERAPTSFFGPLKAAFCPKIGNPAKLTR